MIKRLFNAEHRAISEPISLGMCRGEKKQSVSTINIGYVESIGSARVQHQQFASTHKKKHKSIHTGTPQKLIKKKIIVFTENENIVFDSWSTSHFN